MRFMIFFYLFAFIMSELGSGGTRASAAEEVGVL